MSKCKCFFAGWCKEHNMYTNHHIFTACKNNDEIFDEYKEGGGFRLNKLPNMEQSAVSGTTFVFGYIDSKLDFLQSLGLPFTIFKIDDNTRHMVTHVIGEGENDIKILDSKNKDDWIDYIFGITGVNNPKPPTRVMPSKIKKAITFGKALVNRIKTGSKDVNDAVYQARLDICNRCEFLEGKDCLLCGCPVDKKAKWASESCPAKPSRWEARQEGTGCVPCKKKRGE